MNLKYIGATDEQVLWGNCDDPRDVLEVGQIYKIKKWDVRGWHTKVTLEGVEGVFNSVCFGEPFLGE